MSCAYQDGVGQENVSRATESEGRHSRGCGRFLVGAGFSPRGGRVASGWNGKRPQAEACAYKDGVGRENVSCAYQDGGGWENVSRATESEGRHSRDCGRFVVGAGFSPRGGRAASGWNGKPPQAEACAYKDGGGWENVSRAYKDGVGQENVSRATESEGRHSRGCGRFLVGAGFSPRGGRAASGWTGKRPKAEACAYKDGVGQENVSRAHQDGVGRENVSGAYEGGVGLGGRGRRHFAEGSCRPLG